MAVSLLVSGAVEWAAANSAADGSSGEDTASTFPFILARDAGNLGDLLALLFVIFFMREGDDIL